MAEEGLTIDQLLAWVRKFGGLITEQKDYLTDLDAAIGDGDHGINMDRGMRAVCDQLDADVPAAPGPLFKLVGMALVSHVGGASGPLYGTFFLRLASACGSSPFVPLAVFVQAWHAAVQGVAERGRSEPGDKTMLDSLQPGLEALERGVLAGENPATAFSRAWKAAVGGRDATVPMVARKGRASYLGPRSAGHQDPGATSAALMIEAAAFAFASGN